MLSSYAAPAQVKFVSASEYVLIFFVGVAQSICRTVGEPTDSRQCKSYVCWFDDIHVPNQQDKIGRVCRQSAVGSTKVRRINCIAPTKYGLHPQRTLGAFFHDINISRPLFRVCCPSNTIFQSSLLEPLMEPEISEVI